MGSPSDAPGHLCRCSGRLSYGKTGVRKCCQLSSALFLQSWWPSVAQKWSALFLGCFLGVHEHKHWFPVPGLRQVHS